MANNLEYWDSKLHLEKMRELIKVVLFNQSHGCENYELKDVEVDGQVYNLLLNESGIQINCSDGRRLSICLYPETKFYLKVSPQINYDIGKDKLRVKGDVFKTSNVNIDDVFDRHFVYFDDFYNNDQLIRNIVLDTFNGKRNVEFVFNGSKNFIYRIFHDEYAEDYYFKINNDSLVFGAGIKEECLVTLDGEKIISYNGKELPPFEEINDFNYKDQIEKVKDILNALVSKINPFTIEYIDENLASLKEKQELRDKYMRLYNYELPICKEALQKREEFLKNLNNNIFTEEELGIIISLLKKEMIDRINKDNKKAVVKKKSLNR